VQCRTVLVQELAENRRLRQQLEELQAHCQRQEQELAELRSA
jgi:cell division septum initiation protein DivIVA